MKDNAKIGDPPSARHPAYTAYFHAVVGLGVLAILWASYSLNSAEVSYQWIILASLTLISSSCSVKIPSTNSKISIGDTLIFTNLILFGVGAGVITAALEGLLGSLRVRTRARRKEFIIFNVGAIACTTYASGSLFFLLLGQKPTFLHPVSNTLDILLPLGVLAFTHYLFNSGSVAIIVALENRVNIYSLWKESFLWTSMTYLLGVASAGFIAITMGGVTPQVLGVVIPVVFAVYYTYKTYLDKVGQLKELLQQVKRLAYYDSLTGLPNRGLFKEHLDQAILKSRRDRLQVAAMFLDLDRFKNINDTYGHNVGDSLLKAVAERLKESLRTGDTLGRGEGRDHEISVGRFGGDEFTVMLANVDGAHSVAKVAQRLLQTLSEPLRLDDKELYVSASIGIAMFPQDGTTADTLMKSADAAMYKVKGDGRSSFQFYSPSMNEKSLSRIRLENDLRKALERDQFFLEYQPKIDLETKEIIGTESLIRWRHPTRGVLKPYDFIPLAEECGLIVPIGEWALKTACAQNAAWQEAGIAPLPVAVNLSCIQFKRKDLLQKIYGILIETGLEPSHLELEITESTIMQNEEEAESLLRSLAGLGIRISIDDFGTGYSSFGYLKRFPVTALKIDRTFVKDVTTDTDDQAITKAIIAMAHSLGMRVIAEGVETKEQADFLGQQGCDECQGFLFSVPLPAQEIEKRLSSRHWTRFMLRAGTGDDSQEGELLIFPCADLRRQAHNGPTTPATGL